MKLLIGLLFFFLSLHLQAFLQPTDFVFQGFTQNSLLLSGIASLDSGIIRLTNVSSRLSGRALFPSPVQMKEGNITLSFSTTFVFSITPHYSDLGGHGMAFMMAPQDPVSAFPSQYLGMLSAHNNGNFSNHLFAIEFDTVQDLEFEDIDDNHVGIDLNSMISVSSASAAYRTSQSPKDKLAIDLKSGSNIQAWIEYNGLEKQLNVSISIVPNRKPAFPLLSVHLDLSPVVEEYMHVGFSASTGLLSGTHSVLAWSFNNNGSEQMLDPSVLPSIRNKSSTFKSTGFIIGISIAAFVFLLSATLGGFYFYRKYSETEDHLDDWELEYGPQRFTYKELKIATKGFHDSELLGVGGFGRVYRGVLARTGAEVAVKRLAHESNQGLPEFLAELSTIGRLRHRNLVQLQGWSSGKGEFLLVYDYMINGSLDRVLYKTPSYVLGWPQRFKILNGVAAALLYLHEEWEQQVLHRDIKSSNVLLDGELNGKLGDFGLARLYDHGKAPHTTRVVGTLGYLAPEFTRTGRATASTDVFSFGVLLLEVATGKRPLQAWGCEEEFVLVDWVSDLYLKGRILDAADPKLSNFFVVKEMERVLQLGLLCSQPNPGARPNMRQVVQILSGDAFIPEIPPFVPYSDASPSEVALISLSSL